jgi:hypothetical protein
LTARDDIRRCEEKQLGFTLPDLGQNQRRNLHWRGPGPIAVGTYAEPQLKDAFKWTSSAGVTNLGHYPGQVCYIGWMSGENVCEDRETVAYRRLAQGDTLGFCPGQSPT